MRDRIIKKIRGCEDLIGLFFMEDRRINKNPNPDMDVAYKALHKLEDLLFEIDEELNEI